MALLRAKGDGREADRAGRIRSPASGFSESLLKVEQKILFVLDPDRQPQRSLLDAEASAIGRRHAAVRSRGWMGDERARLTDVDEMREQAEPLQRRARGRFAPAQGHGEDRADAQRAQPFGKRMARMVGQRREADGRNGGMAGEMTGDRL